MGKKKPSTLPDDILQYFAAQGMKGAKKSIAVRKKKYTAEQRSELARKAAAKRWSQQRKSDET